MVSQLFEYTEAYIGTLDSLAKQLYKEFGNSLDSPRYLNRLGGIHYRKDKMDKAIVIYKLNVQLFPEDGNSWDSLGDTYFKANNMQKASEAYSKALELKPIDTDCFWCDNASEKLQQIKNKQDGKNKIKDNIRKTL